MKKTLLLTASLLGSLTVFAAQPLNVKTGQWEITMITQMSGTPPMPPEVLAKMTPEQRAKMEAAFGSEAGPKTHKSMECITKEDLEKPWKSMEEEENCKTSIVKSTSTTQDIAVTCTGKRQTTGKMHVEATSPKSIKATMDYVVTGTSTMQIKSQMKGRWIGPTCKEDDE